MTRVLFVCLLAVMLIEPAAAGTGASIDDQIAIRPHALGAIARGDFGAAMAFWVRNHTRLPYNAIQPSATPPAPFDSSPGNVSPCSQKLAFNPDLRCVGTCDAAKEACDGQCGSVRTTCLSQCVGIGFMCDYQCHASYFICKGRCGRGRDTCVSNCPTRGGEKES